MSTAGRGSFSPSVVNDALQVETYNRLEAQEPRAKRYKPLSWCVYIPTKMVPYLLFFAYWETGIEQ